jgi:hypothetical protein
MFKKNIFLNRSLKWNETFPEYLHTCTWINVIVSKISGNFEFLVKICKFSNRRLTQTTCQNGMKLSQVAYIHVFEILEFFKFIWKLWILVKIWKCTFKLTVLSNDSFKMNQTFPDCLNTCIWISGIFSNFFGNKIWKCTFKSTVLSNDSLKMNETFPDCLHTCIWITGFFQIFLETWIFGWKLEVYIQINRPRKRLIENEWNFPRLHIYVYLNY